MVKTLYEIQVNYFLFYLKKLKWKVSYLNYILLQVWLKISILNKFPLSFSYLSILWLFALPSRRYIQPYSTPYLSLNKGWIGESNSERPSNYLPTFGWVWLVDDSYLSCSTCRSAYLNKLIQFLHDLISQSALWVKVHIGSNSLIMSLYTL